MEHSVAIVSPEGAIKREIKRVRKLFQADETMHSFSVQIKATGRVHDGDVKLTYLVSEDEYGTGAVSGDSLQACVDELQRRRGWTAIHAPKALGYEKVPSDDSDIPF